MNVLSEWLNISRMSPFSWSEIKCKRKNDVQLKCKQVGCDNLWVLKLKGIYLHYRNIKTENLCRLIMFYGVFNGSNNDCIAYGSEYS